MVRVTVTSTSNKAKCWTIVIENVNEIDDIILDLGSIQKDWAKADDKLRIGVYSTEEKHEGDDEILETLKRKLDEFVNEDPDTRRQVFETIH